MAVEEASWLLGNILLARFLRQRRIFCVSFPVLTKKSLASDVGTIDKI